MKTNAPSYRGYRFPSDIISHAVWLYHRFCLSFRDVEDLLAERGVIVSYETIRQWCRKFGAEYAWKLRRRQGRLGDTWYLDELFVTIQAQRKYLWRAFFTNRYEKSTGSRSLVDFNELKPLVVGSGQSSPAVFNDDLHPLPHLPELMLAGWPKNMDRVARAILALALRQGGLDLADGSSVSRSNLAKREYHHLFPDASSVFRHPAWNRYS